MKRPRKRLGFAGGFYDPETGLVRFGACGYESDRAELVADDTVGRALADRVVGPVGVVAA